jgi:hypothetical protein
MLRGLQLNVTDFDALVRAPPAATHRSLCAHLGVPEHLLKKLRSVAQRENG